MNAEHDRTSLRKTLNATVNVELPNQSSNNAYFQDECIFESSVVKKIQAMVFRNVDKMTFASSSQMQVWYKRLISTARGSCGSLIFKDPVCL